MGRSPALLEESNFSISLEATRCQPSDMDQPPLITTHNDFHLGDNLFQLHFLRKLAEAHPDRHFMHFAHECHLPNLRQLAMGCPRVRLLPLTHRPEGTLDSWKNAGAGTPAGGYFEKHPDRNDYYGFYLDWFREQAGRLGFESPLQTRGDLLFDYPALLDATPLSSPFDILLVNSQPCSGQFMAMASDDGHYLDNITIDLTKAGHRIITTQAVPALAAEGLAAPCTRDYGMTVTGIGNLALHCHTIIMIGTGPAWPTMNKFCRSSVRRRILLFEPERVEGFGQWPHVKDREELRDVLQRECLL